MIVINSLRFSKAARWDQVEVDRKSSWIIFTRICAAVGGPIQTAALLTGKFNSDPSENIDGATWKSWKTKKIRFHRFKSRNRSESFPADTFQ